MLAVDVASTHNVRRVTQERSIHEVSRLTGVTSRTLRHYGVVGLLPPSRVGPGGMRYYDADALVRLQRILLLRELGLSLAQIGDVLTRATPERDALEDHLRWLEVERDRLARQIASVESTLQARQRGEEPMAEQMFDGFDHTVHRKEVEERWGRDAYAQSDRWWRDAGDAEKKAFQQEAARLAADWIDAADHGLDAESAEAQALAARHVAWLSKVPGTPAAESGSDGGGLRAYVEGLADLYVADERFAATYGGATGAAFVRAALRVYARTLPTE